MTLGTGTPSRFVIIERRRNASVALFLLENKQGA